MALEILDYFNVIVTSGAVKIKKPDPEIFRIALNSLQSTSNSSVFVGDSLEADIIPAKKLGMFTILKSKDNSRKEPDAICNNLMELPDIIKDFQKKTFQQIEHKEL